METIERTSVVKNGCTGGCCEHFSLPYDQEDLYIMLRIIKADKENRTWTEGFVDMHGDYRAIVRDKDIQQIADMLIPLGEHTYDPQHEQFIGLTEKETYPVKPEEAEKAMSMIYHNCVVDSKANEVRIRLFTCIHFDTVNRICGNYENRPNMCRTFGNSCAYRGCTIAATLKTLNDKEQAALKNGVILPTNKE